MDLIVLFIAFSAFRVFTLFGSNRPAATEEITEMTPILRPTAQRLPLPRIDEEQLPDDEATAPRTLLNENVPSDMLHTRIRRSDSIPPLPHRSNAPARTSQPIQLPPGTECNTENSYYDEY